MNFESNGEMNFSLKQLIMFVTIAAILCGIMGFAYTRVRVAQVMAMEARLLALESHRMAEQTIHLAEQKEQQLQSLIESEVTSQPGQSKNYSILYWNIEFSDIDPVSVSNQLIGLGRYDLVALSGTTKSMVYEQAMARNWPNRFGFIHGMTKKNDSSVVFYDKKRFNLVESSEVAAVASVNESQHAPFCVRLNEYLGAQDLAVVMNTIASGDMDFQENQAAALREWARGQSMPLIALGQCDFDYERQAQRGNACFHAFIRDGVWEWVKPVELSVAKGHGKKKGIEGYFDIGQEFSFVGGAARDWSAEFRPAVRWRDFSGDKKTGEHRPVELNLKR